jgi:hypothetical protein
LNFKAGALASTTSIATATALATAMVPEVTAMLQKGKTLAGQISKITAETSRMLKTLGVARVRRGRRLDATSALAGVDVLVTRLSSAVGSTVSDMIASQLKALINDVDLQLEQALASILTSAKLALARASNLAVTVNSALASRLKSQVTELIDYVAGNLGTLVWDLLDTVVEYVSVNLRKLLDEVNRILETITSIAASPLCLSAVTDKVATMANTWGTAPADKATSTLLLRRLTEAAGVLGTDFCIGVTNLRLSFQRLWKKNITVTLVIDGDLSVRAPLRFRCQIQVGGPIPRVRRCPAGLGAKE